MRFRASPFAVAQAAIAIVVAARFARGRRRRAPLSPDAPEPHGMISVVVPARDEERRLAPCLEALAGDRDVDELLVVDDCSQDATAEVARSGGARVVDGAPLPPGWAGKTWALEQGARAASGDWVCFLDADTRSRPGLLRALVALAEEEDAFLVSAAPRFRCDGAVERLLHAAMAATIPYRVGPADVPGRQPAPARALANGQCVLVRRAPFLAWGGWTRVRGHLTEDVALARAARRDSLPIAFADGADLLEVRMYESAVETWSGWPRSLMAADVASPTWLAADLAVLWLAMALPLPRLVLRSGTALDALLLAARLGITAALARGYAPRGVPFWISPLADLAVAARLTRSVLSPSRTWRGRTYDAPLTPPASARAPAGRGRGARPGSAGR